jgi:putative ABC transport system permease protein
MVGDYYGLFLFIALLVVVVGVSSVAVALFNTMNERRREIAILRAIGARKRTVLAQILGESTIITGIGCVVGLLLARLLLVGLKDIVAARTGFAPEPSWFTPFPPGREPTAPGWVPTELVLLVGVCVVGAIGGLLPAMKGYRTDVATNLAPTS